MLIPMLEIGFKSLKILIHVQYQNMIKRSSDLTNTNTGVNSDSREEWMIVSNLRPPFDMKLACNND